MSQLPSMHRIIVDAGYYDRENKVAPPAGWTYQDEVRLVNKADDIVIKLLSPVEKRLSSGAIHRTDPELKGSDVRQTMMQLKRMHSHFAEILQYVLRRGKGGAALGYWHLWQDEMRDWLREWKTFHRENP